MILKKETSGLPDELSNNRRTSISSSVDPSDAIDGALLRFPTDVAFIVREMERLRTKNAQKKMELDQMSSTFKTTLALKNGKIKDLEAKIVHYESLRTDNSHHKIVLDIMSSDLALKNQKIKELEAEVNQLRGRKEENTIGCDEMRRVEKHSSLKNTAQPSNSLSKLQSKFQKKVGSQQLPVVLALNQGHGDQNQNYQHMNHGFRDGQENRGGGSCLNSSSSDEGCFLCWDKHAKCKHRTSVVGVRMLGLLQGRENPIVNDTEASAASKQRLYQLGLDFNGKWGEVLSEFMKYPYFTCFCGKNLVSGIAVIMHFHTSKHINHRPKPVYQSDVDFWTDILFGLSRDEVPPVL